MKLIALALALLGERFAANLLHVREPHWIDRYFEWGTKNFGGRKAVPAFLAVSLLIALPVLPVLLLVLAFEDLLLGLVYLAFAVVVLFFSLGPRDLEDEVDEYCLALERGEDDKTARVLRGLIEGDPPPSRIERMRATEDAIFVQANNRLFGVILWFMLLGPVGAWAFRVIDLMRRRVLRELRDQGPRAADSALWANAVQNVHGVAAWLPARLLAAGYALAGSFEEAVADWRGYYQDCAERFFERNDEVLACVGRGALGRAGTTVATEVGMEIDSARAAMSLVLRTLWI
ncbi:MAG: regulatory signaling modulator protein AmpE, partial [Gammaproteobacteria bacterium]